MIRRLVLAGLLVGVLAGLVVALALPRTQAAVPPAVAGGAGPLREAPARPRPRDVGVDLRARPGTVRVEASAPDPRRGPAWAVRTFRGERVFVGGARRRGGDRVIGRDLLCAQLGRIHRGRFGWIDATRTFRPVAPGYLGAPVWCGSGRGNRREEPITGFETPVGDLAAGDPVPVQTVAWGLAGPAADRVRLRLGGRAVAPRLGPNGAFVAPGPASLRAGDASVTVTYDSGRPPVRRELGRGGTDAVLEVRTSDPNGGVPHGLLAARDRAGGWCIVGEGRIVGDRAGGFDPLLGLFTESPAPRAGCPRGGVAPTRERPLDIQSGYAATQEVWGVGAPAGRVARRTLPGLTRLSGTAHPDVRSITVATPRDVRTVTPSPRARAFLLVYDGDFPTGEVVFTSTMADGTTRRQVLAASPL